MSSSTSMLVYAWLCCAGFTCFVANHRGRSGVLWGLLGLTFGLLALFVCACLPRRTATD